MTTEYLAELVERVKGHTPGPWELWASNSWRRFGSEDGEVCTPVQYSARDPHPDLHFANGGQDGPDARLIAAAPSLLTLALEQAEELKQGHDAYQRLCESFTAAGDRAEAAEYELTTLRASLEQARKELQELKG